MLITKDIAAQMECCIKQTHIEFTKQNTQGSILELNGGAVCFSGFDSFFSQVIGWGFATKPKHFKNEIETIEAFYKKLNHPRVDLELCPFVGAPLFEFLSDRGYRISEVNSVSVLDLSSYTFADCVSEEFSIRQVGVPDLANWARTVALGFGYPEAEEQFIQYATASGITAFGAYCGDNLVAGATIAIHGNVCDLGVTSTLKAFRGRGLQKKLLLARLEFAKSKGVTIATVTTEPGTVSDLNVQKTGFHCGYTRIKMQTLNLNFA